MKKSYNDQVSQKALLVNQLNKHQLNDKVVKENEDQRSMENFENFEMYQWLFENF